MPKLIQLFANPSSAPGGAERMLGKISQVARSMDWDVEEYHDGSFPLRAVSRRFTMLNVVANVWQLNRHLQKACESADVVVSHGMYGAFLSHPRHIYVFHSNYAAMAEAMRPHVAWLDFFICRYLWGALVERRNARVAEECVAVSRVTQAEARTYCGVASRVIHNCVDDNFRLLSGQSPKPRQAFGLPPLGILILVVGRRETLKGRLLLTELAPRLPSGVHLVSVGSGPEIPGVISLAPVSREDLPSLYGAVDWTLTCSLYEGFGLTLLESLACGTPVIATPTGIVPELLGQESAFDACVASRIGCVDALQSAIMQALADDSLGQRQLLWGRRLIDAQFSEANFFKHWRQVLSSKLEGASPHSKE